MNELKELMEKLDISGETATAIQGVLTEAFEKVKEEGKAEAKAEADKEKEELEESHAAEVTFLKEKAEEYGSFLKEKANDYGIYLKEKANEYGETIHESVATKMKEYADYAIEEFITENKERFVETEEYARMKGTFEYVKEAFERNAFVVQDDVATVELQESLKESTKQYESLFEDLSLAKEELDNLKKEMILERATADLAETQKEKVSELLEAVSFDSIDEYKDGVAMIVEQAKASNTVVATAKEIAILTEEVQVIAPDKKLNESVAQYLTRPGLF